MLERFPELRALSKDEKLRLAEELEEQALSGLTPEQEEGLEAIVQERWEAHMRQPSAGSSLEAVRNRLMNSGNA